MLASEMFDGLIEARRDGHLVGAMFSQITPDKTAIVWLPRLVAGEPALTAVKLFDATWQFLVHKRVVLAQALLPTVDKADESVLRLGGFRRLANLLYLVNQLNDLNRPGKLSKYSSRTDIDECAWPTDSGSCPFDFEPYRVPWHEQWTKLLEATYEGTLDCLGLEDLRNPEEILTGYRSIGASRSSLWWMARRGHQAVGCLFLADHPRHNNMELLYLGLISGARGRGWGKWLAERAKQLARQAGRRRLVLAVDAANTPAIQTYMAVGFQTWQRRELFAKTLIHRPLARIA
jgi:GNAT superfamily N-acetyltransferase